MRYELKEKYKTQDCLFSGVVNGRAIKKFWRDMTQRQLDWIVSNWSAKEVEHFFKKVEHVQEETTTDETA